MKCHDVGDQFILEIEECYIPSCADHDQQPEILYKMKGFNSLVFDERGLNKLTKLSSEDSPNIEDLIHKYSEAGKDIAIEAIKKLIEIPFNDLCVVCNIPNVSDVVELIRAYSLPAILNIVTTYEEHKKNRSNRTFQLGDIVRLSNGCNTIGLVVGQPEGATGNQLVWFEDVPHPIYVRPERMQFTDKEVDMKAFLNVIRTYMITNYKQVD